MLDEIDNLPATDLAKAFKAANPQAYEAIANGTYETTTALTENGTLVRVIANALMEGHPKAAAIIMAGGIGAGHRSTDATPVKIDEEYARANRRPEPAPVAKPSTVEKYANAHDDSFATQKIASDAAAMLSDRNRGKYSNGAAFGSGAGREFAIAAIQASMEKRDSQPAQKSTFESQAQVPSKAMPATPDGMMRAHEAQEALGLTWSSFREAVRCGYITPALVKNGNQYFTAAEVQLWAASRRCA